MSSKLENVENFFKKGTRMSQENSREENFHIKKQRERKKEKKYME